MPTTTQASERTVELTPVSAGYTDLLARGSTSTDDADLRISRLRFRTYLTYDLSGLSPDDEVVAARLALTVGSSDATEPGLDVRTTTADWIPSELSYDNAPTADGPMINPGDPVVCTADSTQSSVLGDLTALQPGATVGLSLSFAKFFTTVTLPKTDAPRLVLTVRSPDPAATVAPVDPSELPYQVDASHTLPRKVFAHYFPPYPVSLDNRDPQVDYYSTQYLNPDGEGGKWRRAGGLLRDRPIGRPPIEGDYELADAATEVDQASQAGIDGFTVDILSWSDPLWARTMTLNRAAEQSKSGFVTVPNLDMTSRAARAPESLMVERLAEFYTSSAAYRLPDGRMLLSSFKAETRSPRWWKRLIDDLQREHGISVAFVGVMLDLTQHRIDAYAPISYGLGVWGVRTPRAVLGAPDLAAAVHRAGIAWIAPIAVQDVRHRSFIYAEAGNTETLRASWTRAIADKADMVQVITWNDYSESTQIAPSQAHGRAFLDVNGYYVTQYKSGNPPAIVGDELVVSHRIQPAGSRPTSQRAGMSWRLSGSGTRPRDTVEVLSMLHAEAEIIVQVGSSSYRYTAPAGLSAHTVPLELGSVNAKATRQGASVVAVTSPFTVVSALPTWDLQYYAVSSRGV